MSQETFFGDDSLEGQVKEYAYLKGIVDDAEKRQKTLKEKTICVH
jgi:hypothetical protein